MSVAAQLLEAGETGRIAIAAGDARMRYAELRAEVDRLARHLMAAGLRKSDRVGLWAENGTSFVVAYLAVIRAGLVVVPLPSDISDDAAEAIVGNAGLSLMLVTRRVAARRRGCLARLPVQALTEPFVSSSSEHREVTFPDIDPCRDLAALMFTSGSTRAPRGVMVTHRNIECNTRDIVAYMRLSAADRVMVVLPFSHCFGLSLLHTHLMAGGSLVLSGGFLYPEAVLDEMAATACSGFAGVPLTFWVLSRRSSFKTRSWPSLRWLQQAGGPLPAALVHEITAACPHARLYTMYGQTEATARMSYLPPERLADKTGSIGMGLPSTRLDVLQANGARVPPGSEMVGEIVASGDNVTLGYWNDPLETARYFRDGRLHTGDLGRVDADGFIFLVDRARDIIKCGGERISAVEIESVIAEIPAVREVAVVGAPDDRLGERVVAFVVADPGASVGVQDVLHCCERRLPASSLPPYVFFLPELPHTSSGKVSKRDLRSRAASQLLG